MSTFSSDIGPEEEDGAGWGGLVATKQERQQEEREAYARKCVRACAGLPDGALDGGWTAAGIISYAKKLEETLSGIAFANYREWDDGLDTAEEFVRWAQSRAIHTLTQNVQKPECSICRRRHGPEVVHACE